MTQHNSPKLGKQSGIGMYSWKDGSSYVGQLDNGMFEGFGVYTYEPEDTVHKQYEGSWKKDKQEQIWSNFTSRFLFLQVEFLQQWSEIIWLLENFNII